MPFITTKKKKTIRRRRGSKAPRVPAGKKSAAPAAAGAGAHPVVVLGTPAQYMRAMALGTAMRNLALYRHGISGIMSDEEAERQFDQINSEYNRILAYLYPETTEVAVDEVVPVKAFNRLPDEEG